MVSIQRGALASSLSFLRSEATRTSIDRSNTSKSRSATSSTSASRVLTRPPHRARQHAVQHDRMKRLLQRQLKTPWAIMCQRYCVAHPSEVIFHQTAEAHIVLDQQQAHRRRK